MFRRSKILPGRYTTALIERPWLKPDLLDPDQSMGKNRRKDKEFIKTHI
jgi:hypothetical protein